MPTYDSIGIWGAVILTVLRFIQGIGVGGEWGGSVLMSMEWTRSIGQSRGFLASWPQFGVPAGLFLANLAVLAFSAMVGRPVPDLGLARPFFLSIVLVGDRSVDPAGHPGDAGVPKLVAEKKIEQTPILEVIKRQPKEICLSALAAHGRAGAVLHLHRLRLRLWRRHAAHLARLYAVRGAGGLVRFVLLDPDLRPPLRPHRPQEDVPDRRRTTGLFGFLYFGMLDTGSRR